MKLHQISVHTDLRRVRPTTGAILGFETDIGLLHLHVLEEKHRRGWAPLVGVPASEDNCSIIATAGLNLPAQFKEWLIPPHQLMKESFGPGGCFVRVGSGAKSPKAGPLSILKDWPFYSPSLCEFIPKRLLDEASVTDLTEPPDRGDWKLRMWIVKSSVREAEGEERTYRTIPSLIFSLEDFDLFIARLFAYLRGDKLPMEVMDSTLNA